MIMILLRLIYDEIEQVLCMLACWVEDPEGDYFKKHLARIPDCIWVGEDGMKMQVRKHFHSSVTKIVVEKGNDFH